MLSDKIVYKFLVVEDNAGDFMLIEDLLIEQFTEAIITNATTFKQASTLLEAEKTPYDAILLDLDLPDKSSNDLIAEMLKKADLTPVIILTGNTNLDYSINAISLGVSDYLVKDDLTKKMLHKSILYSINRKLILENLRAGEAKLNEAQSIAKVGNWETDLSAMKVKWSDEMFRIFGVNPDNSSSSHPAFLEYVHPDDRAKVDAAFVKSYDIDNINSIEHRIITTNGIIKIVEQRWQIFRDSLGNPIRVTGICHDITEKIKVERQLNLLDYSYKHTDSAMFFLDVNGFYIDFNQATANMLGYSYEEFRGKTVMDVNPLVTKESWVNRWEELKDVPNQNFDVKLKRKDGTFINVAVTTNSIELNSKIINFGFYEDITEKMKVAEELKVMDFAFKKSATPIMLLLPTGDFFSFNNAVLNLLGYTKEEFSKMNLLNVATAMDEAGCIKHWDEIREKQSVVFECHFERKDGVLLDVEVSSNLITYNEYEVNFCYINDITERKQAAEELKKSDEFSRGILNSINSCIAVLNKNGEIIKTNQAWKIMSASAEMSKANFISEGKNILDILDKAAVEGSVLAQDTIGGLSEVMNGRMSIYKNQYFFIPTGTNDKWWFDIAILGFTSNSDMVIINIQDITDLKNIEKERDNTQEANINLQKIELELSDALTKEKDLNELKFRFLSMASHEFRTPLTTIMSSLSLISRYAENADTEGQVKHISKIKKSVFTLTDILDDFLSASKLEEGKIENDPKEINLKNFIGDIVLEMQSTATDGRTIVEKYYAKEIATIDQKLLKNIMFNLLSNAIKFSKASGIIEVVIEEFEDSIVIAVKDNGIGISKEDQKHLFQRFFRGYNATHIQGTGLGLNIVAKYAEVMKASLTYESIENKGSIFSLKIPQ